MALSPGTRACKLIVDIMNILFETLYNLSDSFDLVKQHVVYNNHNGECFHFLYQSVHAYDRCIIAIR